MELNRTARRAPKRRPSAADRTHLTYRKGSQNHEITRDAIAWVLAAGAELPAVEASRESGRHSPRGLGSGSGQCGRIRSGPA
jgi:hypothetical protein